MNNKDVELWVKELRRNVKNGKWSNIKLASFFNDMYQQGYKQGAADTFEAASKRLQEAIDAANREFDTSNSVDGVGVQSGSGESSGGAGVHASDGYIAGRSVPAPSYTEVSAVLAGEKPFDGLFAAESLREDSEK